MAPTVETSRPGPSSFPPYQYCPLPSGRSIRLLKLVPPQDDIKSCSFTLSTYQLDDCPPFEALSYTWGPPVRDVSGNEPDQPVTLSHELPIDQSHDDPVEPGNRQPRRHAIPITTSLYDALSGIPGIMANEKIQGQYLWVDAVCIDQSSMDERASQVLLMGDIYSRAEHVIVWLGKGPGLVDHFFFQTIETLYRPLIDLTKRHRREELEFLNPCDEELWAPVLPSKMTKEDLFMHWSGFRLFFLVHRWFSRAWTVQEAGLASRCFLAGDQRVVPMQRVINIELLVSVLQWELPFVPLEGSSTLREGNTNRPEISRAVSWGTEPDSYEAVAVWKEVFGAASTEQRWFAALAWVLFKAVRSCDASNPRDKVYSAFGILSRVCPAAMTNPLKVNYSLSVAEVYQQITTLLLENLPFLAVLSFVKDTGAPESVELPSWVPDYSCRDSSKTLVEIYFKHWHFDASRSRDLPRVPVQISGTALTVHGVKLDSVRVVGDIISFADPMSNLRSILGVVADMDASYAPYKEDIIEALWCTLVWDMRDARGASPAPKDFPQGFHDFVLDMACRAIGLPERQGENVEPSQTIVSTLLTRLRRTDTAKRLLPTMDLVREWKEKYLEHHRSATLTFDCGKSEMIRRTIATSALGRRFYVTANGLLGTGTRSVGAGDEVWLLQGACVPFVLRRNPESNRFILIGESYVRGAMHGELMTDELRGNIRSIEIE